MKARLTLAFAVVAAALGVYAGCYNVGDLGPKPFCCNAASSDPKECPDGYHCSGSVKQTGDCQASAGVTPGYCLKVCGSDADCMFTTPTNLSTKCGTDGLCAPQ